MMSRMMPRFTRVRQWPAIFKLFSLLLLLILASVPIAQAAPLSQTTTTVVMPGFMGEWEIGEENTSGGSGSFVSGPATAPAGTGSFQMEVPASNNGYIIMLGGFNVTDMYEDKRFADLTNLSYAAYKSAGNAIHMPTLQIAVDYDDSDGVGGWQGRLVYEPYYAGDPTPTGSWTTYDATTGAGWWSTGTPQVNFNPGTKYCTEASTCTLAELVGHYPNLVVSTYATQVGFKVGSGNPGLIANVDNFHIAFSGGPDDTYDFDPCARVTNTNTGETFCTIQEGIDDGDTLDGDTLSINAGIYAEHVTVTKQLTLDGAGAGTDPMTATILDGSSLGAGSGIHVNNGVTNVTIQDLTVQNYTLANSNQAGVVGFGGNNNFTLQNAQVLNNNGGRGGVYLNGPVDTVLIDNVTAHNNQGRGIVIWNGAKTHIAITNNDIQGTNCCGIELQDGTASGVTMTGNTVVSNGDSGMSTIGLTSGAGPNVISGNTVTNNGRFGIEIKNPDGTGLDTGDGSIVLENNIVSIAPSPAMNKRDHAGIAVFRRSFIAGNPTGYVDVPNGVVVRNNTVSGYDQQNATATTSEGFGIVVEGVNHTVTGNTLNNNDVGIQEQGGNHANANYVPNDAGDGDQADGQSPAYFGRGNAPMACGNTISGNSFSGNTTDFRQNVAGSGGGVVTNTNTGEVFCSIQAAIDDSDTLDSHTITVGAGVYAELLDVNKEVALVGAGISDVTIDASAFGDYSIEVTRSNVTLSGFTLLGNPSGTYGIKVSGASPTQISGITIQNVKVDSSKRTGIDLNGVTSATIDNVEVTNVPGGNGIALSDSSNIALSNITTSNNAWGGLAIYTYGRYFPLGSDSISLSGTNSFGELNPVYVEAGNYTTPASPAPVTNLSLAGFEYIVRNDTFRAGAPNFTFYQPTQAAAIAYALGLPTPADSYVNKVADGTFWVGTDGTNDMKIQAAVDHVNGTNYVPLPVSNEINVLAGDYEEEVLIDRDVIVQGDSQATTIIHPTMDTGSSGDARAWWLVDSGVNLTLQRMTFDGTGYKVWQVLRHKGSGTIDDVAFTQIKFNEGGPSYAGTAVSVFGAGNVDVTNSTFTEIGRIGVQYYGAGITGSTYSDNSYTGKGDGDFLDYALDIGAGAVVIVDNNTISENRGVASSDGSTSAGILVSTYYGAGTQATITNNTVSNSSVAVAIGFNNTDASTVTATGNTFTDNEYGVIMIGSGTTATLLDNTMTNSGMVGVGVKVGVGAEATIGDLNDTGQSNEITGFATGIDVYGTAFIKGNIGSIDGNTTGILVENGGTTEIRYNDIENNDTGVQFASGSTSTEFACNNLVSNTTDADNLTGGTVDATYNYWDSMPATTGDTTVNPRLASQATVDCENDTILGVTIGYFHATRSGDGVDFVWQTATESGVAGFTLYAELDDEMTALTTEMIPSVAIDSITPTSYYYRATTAATLFYLDEQKLDGSVIQHGPFVLDEVYGDYALPGNIDLQPTQFLPLVWEK
ncbi:MAG: right-handed parallel beta-helix repeat-containing protein [Caldilineaceae bacterium]|nr:right-handed parallel beta-helix repeat-containing protein [Caldilineaceae bacterium]